MGRHEQYAKPSKKPKLSAAKRRRRRRILSVAGILTVSLAIWLVVYFLTPPAQVEPPPAEPEPEDTVIAETDPPETNDDTPQRVRKTGFYTMLLVGTMDNYNTDTIMLASVDSEQDIVNVCLLYTSRLPPPALRRPAPPPALRPFAAAAWSAGGAG